MNQEIIIIVDVFEKTSEFTKFHIQKKVITYGSDDINPEEYIDSDSDDDYTDPAGKPNLNKEFYVISEDYDELDINNTEMYIDDKKCDFSKECKFDKKGKHTVKYVINKTLTTLSGMFYNCYYNEKITFNIKTDEVLYMNDLFNNCKGLVSVEFNNFNTKKVETMSQMFAECYSLKAINLDSFDTKNVKSMYAMFTFCISLPEIEISHFNVENLENCSEMFVGCKSLEEIDIKNFVGKHLNNCGYMFLECPKLESLSATPQILEANKSMIPKGCNIVMFA